MLWLQEWCTGSNHPAYKDYGFTDSSFNQIFMMGISATDVYKFDKIFGRNIFSRFAKSVFLQNGPVEVRWNYYWGSHL